MDPAPQQATAVIREGDPSQSRPNNSDVKVDAAEPANASGTRGRGASKDPDKKIKNKKTRKKQSGGGKTKKSKKKKQSIPSDESSDLSEDDDDDSSDEDSESSVDIESDEASLPKRASKKAIIAHKSTSRKSKPQHSKKSHKNSNRTLLGKSLTSDTSESDWDSSDAEDEVDEVDDDNNDNDNNKNMTTTKKKRKNPSVSNDIRIQVARELQRLIQLAQAQPVLPNYPSLGAGLGGGLDAGLGLSALNCSQGARGAFGGFPTYAGGQNRSSRFQPQDTGMNDSRGDLGDGDDDEDEDEDDNPVGIRRQRTGDSGTGNKQRDGGSTDQGGKSKKIDFKRVDQVWDNTIHNFKLQATAESNSEAKYDGFCFHVRRTFDWEGKYKATMVDIKSKALRECLQDVIGNIKGVSLVDETPKLDPNILFL